MAQCLKFLDITLVNGMVDSIFPTGAGVVCSDAIDEALIHYRQAQHEAKRLERQAKYERQAEENRIASEAA